MVNSNEIPTCQVTATDNEMKVTNENTTDAVEVLSVTSITCNGTTFTAKWKTEGLEIPMVVNDGYSNKALYLRIPRDVVVGMFKDIMDELSHT